MVTNVLGVVLESAAIAAVLSAGSSLVSLALVALFSGRSPGARADAAFVAAILPAAVVSVALIAGLAPSVLATVGADAVDHCPQHLHHPHLCVVHFGGLRPAAAVLGALVLAVFVVRSLGFVARHRRIVSSVDAIERLGEVRGATSGGFALVVVPGSARLCHAVGALRRRVLVSSAFLEGMSERAWSAVHAHEVEHLRRRDPLAMIVVEAALLFAPPFLSGALGRAFRRGAEGACDAGAAQVVGDPLAVAESLLEAARVVAAAPCQQESGALAATDISLEDRVRELLDTPTVSTTPARGFVLGAALAVLLAVLGVAEDAAVHHALETLLFHLS